MRRILGWGGGLGVALSALLLLCSCEITERQVRQGQQIDALREQVLRLERAVDELRKARPEPARPPVPAEWNERLADLGQRVEALDARVRELLGRVDALERKPRAAPPAESPRLARLEKQLAELSRRLKALEERPRPGPPAPQQPAEPPAARPPTGRELYDQAYGLYQKGRYEDARRAFRKFLDLYPKSDLADNAYFWIGESYYAQQQYEKAILAYDKVVQEFPRGDKVPSALLKQAFAFDAIGDPVDARILLKKLLREHPSSEQAEIARKKLRMLGE